MRKNYGFQLRRGLVYWRRKYKNKQLPTEYINRLKLERKNRPRHSYFWTGLYGTTWVLSMDICWQWVEKSMRTAINKLPFYQQGLRAMKLIQRLV
jgi:hypothetical protein